jgi:glycosyltransferase involved in cell wall biosynthesis
LRRQLGLGQDLVIGHVARCSPEKNQHLLLDAFRDVLQRVPGVHLVLVGDGPLREALKSHAAALGVSGRVHFVGVRHDMPEVYRGFDVFVLPSLAEGTSMSILEAMASGRAIVASAVGGSPHLLDGGACGVLVPATSRASLVQALEELCRAPERRRALGLAARQRAVTHFSEDQMTEAYVRVYLGRPADPPPMGHDPCAA